MGFSGFVDQLLSYVNGIIGLLISIGAVVFLWGLLSYVSAGDDTTKRNKGRDVIIWGIIGLAVMIGMWGLVNIVAGTISSV
jgi:uncharacterized membrane protein YedE/YeeE